MSQSAHGSGNIQVSVAASEHVNISIHDQLAVQLWAPRYPIPLPEEPHEIDLLKAVHAQVPFTGRQAVLDDFLAWCAAPRALSMRSIIGKGGAGKTRFAYELYARVRQQPGWAGYFLRFHKNEAKEVDLWREIKTRNALIIADYAADGAQPLADLLRPLADSAPEGYKLRVLLLARTASWEQGWLAALSSGRTGEDVERHFHPRDPIEFPPFTSEERQAIFQQTVSRAAEYMGKLVPKQKILASEFERKEIVDRLADPLTLMMAALITLETGQASALSLNRTNLAFEISQKLVAHRMKEAVKGHKDLFLHMAAYVTLCGGLQENEALATLEQESRATHLGNVTDPKAFLDRLQAWLPGEKTWIGAIEPDIVGEAFVLGKGKRMHLHDAEATVMRAAEHKRGPVIQTIVRMAQDFSFAETEERLEPLEWLTKLIERGEADNNFRLLLDLSNALPKSSVVLGEVGVSISSILCARLRELFESSQAEASIEVQSFFAESLCLLAYRQISAGQREKGLATAKEATALSRKLSEGDRNAFLNLLAASLLNLSSAQHAAGQLQLALASAEEAAVLYQELAARNRDVFLPSLAMSLNNLSNGQSDVGQREAALTTAEEAVRLRRELAARDRNAFLPYLATSLNNLANRHLEAKQPEAALAAVEEATAIYRELARHNRDAFLPDLAMLLNTLAIVQSAAGQRETALATIAEGLHLRRELAARNPAAFLEGLAKTCGTYGSILAALARHFEAAASFAEGIRSVLPGMRQYPAAYLALCWDLVKDYLSSAEAANIEPDKVLMQEAFTILAPYLNLQEEGEQP